MPVSNSAGSHDAVSAELPCFIQLPIRCGGPIALSLPDFGTRMLPSWRQSCLVFSTGPLVSMVHAILTESHIVHCTTIIEDYSITCDDENDN